jgi:hypothetical protein
MQRILQTHEATFTQLRAACSAACDRALKAERQLAAAQNASQSSSHTHLLSINLKGQGPQGQQQTQHLIRRRQCFAPTLANRGSSAEIRSIFTTPSYRQADPTIKLGQGGAGQSQ